jgi:hypothetical protein
MRNFLVPALSVLTGGVAGFAIAQSTQREVSINLTSGRAVANKLEYGCVARAHAAVFEGGPQSKAVASKDGSDRVAIKIDLQNRSLSTVMSAALEAGRIDPAKHQIVLNNDETLVAMSFEDRRHAHVFYFDKKNERLMWTKTTSVIGLMGQSLLYECD